MNKCRKIKITSLQNIDLTICDRARPIFRINDIATGRQVSSIFGILCVNITRVLGDLPSRISFSLRSLHSYFSSRMWQPLTLISRVERCKLFDGSYGITSQESYDRNAVTITRNYIRPSALCNYTPNDEIPMVLNELLDSAVARSRTWEPGSIR